MTRSDHPAESAEDLVGRLVRGDVPVETIERLGLTLLCEDDQYRLGGSGTTVVRAHIADVAAGVLKHAKAGRLERRRWSSVLLAASAVIDLGELEDAADGEPLLEALWDAASGGEIRQDQLVIAERVLAGAPEEAQ